MQRGRLKYDIFFKKVFHKKHILKAFLNTVLVAELPSPITDLSYEPTDFIISGPAKILQETKHDVIDIFCITEQQQRILVELQKGTGKRAMPRFLDYQCRNYSNQFPTGTDYSRVVPCYSICWLFDIHPPHPCIKETIALHSDCEQTDWTFDWEIIALYPQNIPPDHIEQHTIDALEEWLLLDVIQDIATAHTIRELVHTQEVKEAFDDLDLTDLSEEEVRRLIFEEQMSEHQDLYEEKLHEKSLDIAKNLLDVLDIETICSKTGLSREEVEALQEVTDK